MKRILLAGHSVEDHFIRNGTERVQPGGIYYSAAAMQAMLEPSDQCVLCTSIQASNYGLFSTVYDLLERRFIRTAPQIPAIYLTLFEDREREERYEHLTDPLDFTGINFAGYDGIFLNMITGFEFGEGFIAVLRSQTSAPIYIDVHSLARGINHKQERHFRKLHNTEAWLSGATFVQANELELMTLGDSNSEPETAARLLSLGIKAVLVTKGKNGSRCYYRERDETASYYLPAFPVAAVNSIGCGDTFGAVFFYTYILTGDLLISLRRGNVAAALAASYDSVSKIRNLKQDVIDRSH